LRDRIGRRPSTSHTRSTGECRRRVARDVSCTVSEKARVALPTANSPGNVLHSVMRRAFNARSMSDYFSLTRNTRDASVDMGPSRGVLPRVIDTRGRLLAPTFAATIPSGQRHRRAVDRHEVAPARPGTPATALDASDPGPPWRIAWSCSGQHARATG
jgi:hypothetical protein